MVENNFPYNKEYVTPGYFRCIYVFVICMFLFVKIGIPIFCKF